MAEFINPALYLDQLVDVFEEAAAKPDGATFEPVLCRLFAQGLTEIANQVEALIAASGAVERFTLLDDRPRTPVERRNLARLSARLDPAGRILSFPTAALRWAPVIEGGSAA